MSSSYKYLRGGKTTSLNQKPINRDLSFSFTTNSCGLLRRNGRKRSQPPYPTIGSSYFRGGKTASLKEEPIIRDCPSPLQGRHIHCYQLKTLSIKFFLPNSTSHKSSISLGHDQFLSSHYLTKDFCIFGTTSEVPTFKSLPWQPILL